MAVKREYRCKGMYIGDMGSARGCTESRMWSEKCESIEIELKFPEVEKCVGIYMYIRALFGPNSVYKRVVVDKTNYVLS